MDDGVIGPSGGEEAIDRPDETSQTEPQVTDHEQQADVGRLPTTLQPAAGDVVTAQPHRQSNEDESEQSVSDLGAGDRDEESGHDGQTQSGEGAIASHRQTGEFQPLAADRQDEVAGKPSDDVRDVGP